MGLISYIILAACAISSFLAVFTLRYRKTEGSVSFSLIMIAASLYSFGYAFELNAAAVQDIRFWLNIEYLGISWIPALWIVFVLQYTGKKSYLKIYVFIVLLSISAITLIMNLTNEYHHLYYRDISVDSTGPFPVAILTKGIWYWAHIAYFNISILIGNYLFIKMIANNSGGYSRQAWIMLTGSFIPWISTTINILGLSPYGLDLNPLTLMITGVVFSIGILQFRVLDLVPIALEYVFESVRDGRILIDIENRIVNFNNAAGKIFGGLAKDSIGKKITEVENIPLDLTSIIDSGTGSGILYELKSGERINYYQINVSPIKNSKGRLLGQIVMMYDMTELKIAEQKLIALNATKDKFFSIIAHDLRNPFAAFKMSLEYMVTQYEDFTSDEIIDLLKPLQEGSRNIYELLENLLQWSRFQQKSVEHYPEPIDIHKIADNNFSLLKNNASNKGVALINEIAAETICFADINMASAIIRNLVSNSIKFTHAGGSITIGCCTAADQPFCLITVSDTGIGMTQDTLDKLFMIDANFTNLGTANEKGTGLGLILCKEFVELHGGKIWAESEYGKGSSFHFTLPARY